MLLHRPDHLFHGIALAPHGKISVRLLTSCHMVSVKMLRFLGNSSGSVAITPAAGWMANAKKVMACAGVQSSGLGDDAMYMIVGAGGKEV